METHWQPLLAGSLFLVVLLGMKKLSAKYKTPILRALAPLTVVLLGAPLSVSFCLLSLVFGRIPSHMRACACVHGWRQGSSPAGLSVGCHTLRVK